MVGSVMVISVLRHCARLHSICDLKASRINVQCSLIWELMIYKFKLGYKAAEAIKNIYCAKDEDAVDHSKQRVQEVLLGLQV